MYILSAREKVINKSNKIVYCVNKRIKESKFSKDISGEETSSKVPATNTPRVFVYSKQRGHDVFTESPRRFNTKHTQCIYRPKTIIKLNNYGESLLQRVFRKLQLQKNKIKMQTNTTNQYDTMKY